MPGRLSGQEWLLLLVAAEGATGPADPVRIMKGAFVICQALSTRGVSPPYEFVPYHYGPFSREVYGDLGSLCSAGLIAAEPEPYASRWPVYAARPAASSYAEQLRERIGPEWSGYVTALRHWLDKQTFSGLLQHMYKRYPYYASATVLPQLTKPA
jgi:hypothetical protein